MKKIILTYLWCLLACVAYAQVTVNAVIDSTYIFIGQQAHITLKVTANSKSSVQFPSYPSKQLIQGIEVLKEEMADTSSINNGQQQSYTKIYTVTSFDSAVYYIPPMKVMIDGKEDSSKSLALKVLSVDVDTLHVDKFCGPKDIMDVSYSWQDWKGIFMMSILLVLMLIFAGYIALQLHNNRPLLKNFRLKAILPPHLWAMKEIEKLKEDTIKSEDAKEYYSELTDVLRSYIQRRYGFNAREMTSGEIIEKLMASSDQEAISELKELFYTADLAKFAKLQTQLNENDRNLLRAMDFINATKVEETENPKEKEKIVPQEVKRTNRDRLILKFSVTIVLLLCAGLLFEICRSIYNLLY